MYQGLGIQGLVQYHPFPQRVKVFWAHRHAKKPFQIQCAMKRCSKDKGRRAFLLRVMALGPELLGFESYLLYLLSV